MNTKTMRAFFLRLALREKILIVAFVLLILAVWGSNFTRRVWQFKGAANAATVDLATQQLWLDNQQSIEEGVRKTAEWLVPERTLDATALLAVVSDLAKEAGLTSVRSSDAHRESNGQFNVHTMVFTIDRVEWEPFKRFYLSLEGRFPYIGIEKTSAVPDRSNPALTSVALTLSASEVAR
jgi:hypothetical protein